MTAVPYSVDVVIIGGGPVGLTIGVALQRMKVSTCILERTDKPNVPMYGRACTLYPRTIEMIEQLGLLNEFAQVSFIAQSGVSYKDGKRITSRGWQHLFSALDKSFHKYCLNIRLKYSEDILREAYIDNGGRYLPNRELKELSHDVNKSDGFKVTSVIATTGAAEKTQIIRSKYLVGADGGHSAVRKLAGIKSEIDSTTYHWVRIDGIVETDMPDSELGVGSIESEKYGNVLWVNLDHGAARIGFAVNPDLYERYGGKLTEEQAVLEAKAAMAPFNIEFKEVHWYTLYSIRQSVAEKFIVDDCIILAGDACHIHSSGAAQGMNTGVHDAVNLSWKLGGIVSGLYKPEILQTYEDERRKVAQYLIALDKDISALVSGDIPEKMQAPGADAHELFSRLYRENVQFNVGLGVHYDEENLLNQPSKTGAAISGWRAPDALVYAPGSQIPVRIQQVTPNDGRYWVLVFAGETILTQQKIQALRYYIDKTDGLSEKVQTKTVQFATIIRGVKSQGDRALGVKKFGNVYYDPDGSAHSRYGMSPENGGVAILRPDGILAFATMLDQGEDMGQYFGRVLA